MTEEVEPTNEELARIQDELAQECEEGDLITTMEWHIATAKRLREFDTRPSAIGDRVVVGYIDADEMEDLKSGKIICPTIFPEPAGRKNQPLFSATLEAGEGVVRVKPLELEEVKTSGALSGRGAGRTEYTLLPIAHGAARIYGIQGDSDGGTSYRSVEDAKAAAQADYEKRILSALFPQQEGK